MDIIGTSGGSPTKHAAIRRELASSSWTWVVVLAVAVAPGHTALRGQAPDAAAAPTEITLELIMADPDWLGRSPQSSYWADDSSSVYYSSKRLGEEQLDLIQIDLQGTVLGTVTDEERGRVGVARGRFNHDRTSKVYAREGDIYVKDLASGRVRQLTRTREDERNPIFLVAGDAVAFERDGQIFVRQLDTGLEWQPFDVRETEDPETIKAKKQEKPDYLRDQQERLLDTVRLRKEREETERVADEAEQQADGTRVGLPWYLGKDKNVRSRSLSPTADWLLLRVAPENEGDGQREQMARFITDDGYVESAEIRTKVGTGEPAGETLMVLSRADHQAVTLDLAVLPGIEDDPLAAMREATKDTTEKTKESDADTDATEPAGGGESKVRPVRLSDLTWSDDGRRAVFQAFSLDNKDRWIAAVDLDERTVVPLYRTTDPAWINYRYADVGWLPDSSTIYFLSEQSGYSQLYLHSLTDGTTRALTEGDYVVSSPEPSADGRYIYFTGNLHHPGVYEVSRVETAGGAITQLTDLGGLNSALLSPDEASLLITHSTTTEPPELYLQAAEPGAAARRVTETTSDEFRALPWVAPEVVAVPSSHFERPIYARLYLPSPSLRMASSDGRRPAVVFVHGAGYLQNSHLGWSRYFREFMFHTFLTQQGFVVLDMDYRGSAGYGRDWRTAIYRQMGTPELEDLADGVAWLVANHRVDGARVGVYGGSYGGFLTLMALFTEPDLFAAGAALRPVTDWAHYNHRYTSNILNIPSLDPEAYERSSPIEFAEGLEKPLLICHGMVDDNVLFLDTVRLVQRLIELEKQDWEVAIYPVEPHGFREPSSWLDEYRRIYKLFDTHLFP